MPLHASAALGYLSGRAALTEHDDPSELGDRNESRSAPTGRAWCPHHTEQTTHWLEFQIDARYKYSKMHETRSCQLCGRRVSMLTRHHLIPRTRHANKRNKREFERKEVKRRIAWLCRACHDHLHALFGEKTLEREFNTLESLAAHPEVKRFVVWIRKKPPDFRPTSHDFGGKI